MIIKDFDAYEDKDNELFNDLIEKMSTVAKSNSKYKEYIRILKHLEKHVRFRWNKCTLLNLLYGDKVLSVVRLSQNEEELVGSFDISDSLKNYVGKFVKSSEDILDYLIAYYNQTNYEYSNLLYDNKRIITSTKSEELDKIRYNFFLGNQMILTAYAKNDLFVYHYWVENERNEHIAIHAFDSGDRLPDYPHVPEVYKPETYLVTMDNISSIKGIIANMYVTGIRSMHIINKYRAIINNKYPVMLLMNEKDFEKNISHLYEVDFLFGRIEDGTFYVERIYGKRKIEIFEKFSF